MAPTVADDVQASYQRPSINTHDFDGDSETEYATDLPLRTLQARLYF